MGIGEVLEELNDMIGRVHREKLGRVDAGFPPLSDDQIQLMKRIADHSSAGTALMLALEHIDYLADLVTDGGLEDIAKDRAQYLVDAAVERRNEARRNLDRLTEIAREMRAVMLGQKIHNPVLDELAEVLGE